MCPKKVVFYFVFVVCVLSSLCSTFSLLVKKTTIRLPPLLPLQQWYQSGGHRETMCANKHPTSLFFSPSAHAIFQDLDRGNI